MLPTHCLNLNVVKIWLYVVAVFCLKWLNIRIFKWLHVSLSFSNQLWQCYFEIWVGLSRENSIQKYDGGNSSAGAPVNFPGHLDLLTSLFWGEESGTGNEIRGVGCLCVLVPPQSATAFKGPAPVRVQCLGCGHGSRSIYTCPIVQICLQ